MFSKNSLFAFNNVIIIYLSCLSRRVTQKINLQAHQHSYMNDNTVSTNLYMNSIYTPTWLNTQIYRFNRFYIPQKNVAMQYTVFRLKGVWHRKVCIFRRCVYSKVCEIGKGVYIQKVCKSGKGV
jgi:hypothetical protein